MSSEKIPCPFVYANGKTCPGHVVRIAAFKVDLEWTLQEDGSWARHIGEPRSHYHLYCSEKGNHAGYDRPDSEKLKFYRGHLAGGLDAVIG